LYASQSAEMQANKDFNSVLYYAFTPVTVEYFSKGIIINYTNGSVSFKFNPVLN